jgi:hypothetical protein
MPRIGVLAPHQALTAKPTDTVTRTQAKLLLRRNLAVLVSKHLIQMLAIREGMRQLQTTRIPLQPRPYIPEKLPQAELPGIIFKPPLRPEWVNSYYAPQS